MKTAIQTDHLQLELSGKTILERVSFSMKPGEFVSVIGPNGAGKSSLIKCLCGIHPVKPGQVHLLGRDATELTSRERARLVSYVPQAEGKSCPFTAEEFLLLSRYPHLSPFTTVAAADHQAVEAAFAKTGTSPLRHRRLSTLSGGERQMVFIAAALAQNAEILILDEPATFLDYRHQSEVFKLLCQLNREHGHCILTVSHDINTAARCSSRILAIKHGTDIFYGTPEELLTPGRLADIFNTDFRFIRDENHPMPFVITDT